MQVQQGLEYFSPCEAPRSAPGVHTPPKRQQSGVRFDSPPQRQLSGVRFINRISSPNRAGLPTESAQARDRAQRLTASLISLSAVGTQKTV